MLHMVRIVEYHHGEYAYRGKPLRFWRRAKMRTQVNMMSAAIAIAVPVDTTHLVSVVSLLFLKMRRILQLSQIFDSDEQSLSIEILRVSARDKFLGTGLEYT